MEERKPLEAVEHTVEYECEDCGNCGDVPYFQYRETEVRDLMSYAVDLEATNETLKSSICTMAENQIELEEHVIATEDALTGAISCIESMKCCGNCQELKKAIDSCWDSCCKRNTYFQVVGVADKWQPKGC